MLERQLIIYCIVGILLGASIVSLPFIVMQTSKYCTFYPCTSSNEARNDDDKVLAISLMVIIGLITASSTFILFKRQVMS